MSTHKHIDKICLVAAILSLILCAVFMNGEALGIQAADKVMGYEDRLFNTAKVHTIDIVIDDWEGFLETAQSEEYSVCSVVIDGEAITNVGIRGKGNTSLSTVSSMDSDRYSFKIEFDQYDSTKTYHGLDKLSLNNIIQDNTYMKDYLSYQMMNEFGVAAPLCSYAYITVNGEDWGLYLAVEAVEESFLQRNYGSNYGELYKPDSMNFGGGRGNGKDFDMNDFINQQDDSSKSTEKTENGNTQSGRPSRGGMTMPGGNANGDNGMPSFGNMPGNFGSGGFSVDEKAIRSAFAELGLDASILDGIDFDNITMENIQSVFADLDEETLQSLMQKIMGSGDMQMPVMSDFGGFGGFGGMGGSETKLQYIDDDPDSYSTIFGSAKTDITEADQNRLISSLKQLSAYENLENVVNVDDVLRYFVVHNYVVNGDSYTGNMIHNYYLYEENGQLSMIPWDYNLAFGTFQGGNASSSVNDDIDEVLSDRPMQAWIFSDETYSQQYYELYAQLLEQVDIQGIIDHAYELIAPYVEKDPTAFCTYEEFQTGVETLKEFCTLRTESVKLQLSGSAETIDVGTLDLSDMGTMNMGGMGGGRGDFGGRGNRGDFGSTGSADGASTPDATPQFENQSAVVPGGTQAPEIGDTQLPAGEEMPENTQPGVIEIPGGMEMPEGMQRFDGTVIPDSTQSPGKGESVESNSNQGSDSTTDGSTQSDPSNGTGGFRNFSPSDEMPDFGNMGNFNGMMNNGQSTGTNTTSIILLAVSILFLAAGLIVAFKFKR